MAGLMGRAARVTGMWLGCTAALEQTFRDRRFGRHVLTHPMQQTASAHSITLSAQ